MTAITNRRRLPNRRQNETLDLNLNGQQYSVCIGYFEDSTPGEIFVTGPKIGSEMDSVLQDSAILASLALQFGAIPAALAASMSRRPTSMLDAATAPSSPIGLALDLMAEMDGGDPPEAPAMALV